MNDAIAESRIAGYARGAGVGKAVDQLSKQPHFACESAEEIIVSRVRTGPGLIRDGRPTAWEEIYLLTGWENPRWS